jgi:PPOX class probable F420-dependent enzyme
MSATLDGRARELLEEPNFGSISTLRADGTPHVTIAWVDVDGNDIVVNSARGRGWPSNLERDPRVALAVPNRENPYEYVEIRGHLKHETPEGADEHIDKLAKKYLGVDTYPLRQEGEVRVKLTIEPDSIRVQGAS